MPSPVSGTTPGVSWVTSSVKNKDLPVLLLHDWYEEHMNDILSCPGNSGLFLRYKNVNPDANPYVTPSANPADTTWPFLALVKLNDVTWLAGNEFRSLPMTSKLLPSEQDRSEGNVFNSWNGAPRSYETVGRVEDPRRWTGRPKYILTVQLNNMKPENWHILDKQIVAQTGFRGAMRCQLGHGLLAFEEQGDFPSGLIVYAFDSGEPPRLQVDESGTRMDVWTLLCERGDSSLRL